MSTQHLLFVLLFSISAIAFGYTAYRIISVLLAAKKIDRFDKIGQRLTTTLLVAFGQTKMLRKPVAGILHALVWWGFIVITIGTLEIAVDGLTGNFPGSENARALSSLGIVYDLITASGDVFAALIALSVVVFLIRRYITKPKRFTAPEMKPKSRWDATVILSMIFLLMVSLLLMNSGYILSTDNHQGYFPVSNVLKGIFENQDKEISLRMENINWWIHISLVLIFLNILPYSKHFHVIMSVPNVFFSRLEPFSKLNTMPSVTQVVKNWRPNFIPLLPKSNQICLYFRSGIRTFGLPGFNDSLLDYITIYRKTQSWLPD